MFTATATNDEYIHETGLLAAAVVVVLVHKSLYERDKDFVTSRLGAAFVQILKGTLDTNLSTVDSTLTYAGIESVTDVELTLHKSISYTGKLTLYKALFFSEKDAVAGTP